MRETCMDCGAPIKPWPNKKRCRLCSDRHKKITWAIYRREHRRKNPELYQKYNREKLLRTNAKMAAAGCVRITVWIPAEGRDELKAFAKSLMGKYGKENTE